MDAVGDTALWVAAFRAIESERPDRMFEDPFAHALAGEEGLAHARKSKHFEREAPIVELRTVFLDEHLIDAMKARDLRQIVVLAAGMDARAFRLPLPADAKFFEVDRADVLDLKEARLAGATPGCERRTIKIDLRDDWVSALEWAGFDRKEPTAWLVEGLLVYLEEANIRALVDRMSELSAPASRWLFDLVGQSLLTSARTKAIVDAMRARGSPWQFGSDDPEGFARSLGWNAQVTMASELGHRLGRWPHPLVPRSTPNVPRTYFVDAVKL